jgi:copper chaperone CopZ
MRRAAMNPSLFQQYLKRAERFAGAPGMAEITLRIDGMHCGSCIRRVTQAIGTAGPFAVEEVRLGAARFQAPDEAETVAADLAVAALAKAGFSASVDA